MRASEGPDSAEGGLFARAVRQTGWSALQQVGVRGVHFLVHLGFARLLLPRHFGLVTAAAIFTTLLGIAGRMGLRTALIQEESVEPEDLATVAWTSFGLAILVLVASLGAGPLAAVVFDQAPLARIVPAMAVGTAFTNVGLVPRAALERNLAFRTLSLIRLAAGLAAGVLGLGLALAGAGVWSLVAHTVTGAGLTAVATWRWADVALHFRFSWARLRRMIRFGSAYTGEQLLNFVSRRADDFVIGVVLGESALGLYRIAYIILEALTGILGRALNAVALPVFSRSREDDERLRRRFLGAVEVTVLVAMPVWAGFAVVADTAVPLLFGERWSAAVPVVRVLAAAGFGHSVLLLNATAMYARGRSDLQLRLAALYAAVNVVGFTIGVRWGLVGVAAALALETFLTAPVELAVLRRLVGLGWGEYFKKFWRPAVAAATMVLGLIGLRWTSPLGPAWTLAAAVPAGALLYGVTLSVIDRSYVRQLAERFSAALRS